MSPRQIIVLAVAIVSALGAVLLIRGLSRPAPAAVPVEAPAPAVGDRVLIVARDLAQGVVVTPEDLAWATFPQEAVAEAFVTEAEQADAQTAWAGSVTRRNYFAGEPVTPAGLIQPGAQGVFAAQLAPGYRAIAITVDNDSAAGGFIQPNDRVDVLLTRAMGEEDEVILSDVILENVRVLAFGEVAQPTAAEEGPPRIDARVAVLELTAFDARTVARAETLGALRLALRGVQEEPPGLEPPTAQRFAAPTLDEGVRGPPPVIIHSYGVASGGSQ